MSANPVAARRQNYSAKMRRDGLPPIWPSCRSCCASPDCRGLPAVAAGWHTHYRLVENRWKSSGKHVGGAKNKHGVVLIWWRRAEERGVCRLVDTALSFKSFRTVLGRAPFLVSDCSFCQSFAARVSSDSPRLKAFCRVAPSVLLNVRAMFAARVFFAASFFKLRTSFAVHDRLFILRLQDQKMKIVLLPPNKT